MSKLSVKTFLCSDAWQKINSKLVSTIKKGLDDNNPFHDAPSQTNTGCIAYSAYTNFNYMDTYIYNKKHAQVS
ncbi:hypothetical protein N7516_004104 [Penicillium verrucosum]|uniref:uncharacterized protein n=1 Tax=Penicillium verrucosum TaxID=60171 RepID=UPI002545196E|nr:uncharacterized protein N7516_004104 [Penicillium verrucosum]KAJ5943936.1 hypothetical protein N7516_004104 [Penicillium verrucosum]